MKVLVTGAGSLLLGSIAAALARRGDEVVALQRREVDIPGVRSAPGDIRDPDAVSAAMAGCDAVVHGAARVGIVGSWDDFRTVNVDGTVNVIEAARARQVARVVHVSTPSVAHEGDSLVGVGAQPASLGRRGAFYAESKAVAEQLALQADDDELAVVAIRPHLVWGPGDTQLVGRIVDRARSGRLAIIGSGSALIDSTYLDNAVSAHLAALDAIRPGAPCAGRAYVIANGEPRTVGELLRGICDAAGVPYEPKRLPLGVARRVGAVVERAWPRLRPDDEPPITRFLAEQLGTAHWFDPRPARVDLGWRPTVTLDEGFERLRAWFDANS